MRSFLILFFCIQGLFANDILLSIKRFEYKKAESLLNSTSFEEDLRVQLEYYLGFHKDLGYQINEIPLPQSKKEQSYRLFLLNKGYYYFYNIGNESTAFDYFKKSLLLSKKHKDKLLICEALKAILELYNNFDKPFEDKSYHYFLQQYAQNTYDDFEIGQLTYYKYRLILRYNRFEKDVKLLYREANKVVKKINAPLLLMDVFLTNASYHFHTTKKKDSAYYFLDKVLAYKDTNESPRLRKRLIAAQMNKSRYLDLDGRQLEALKMLNEIEIDDEGHLFEIAKTYWYYNKQSVFENLKMMDSAIVYQNKYYTKENELNQYRSLTAIAEIETKYQTAEKEKQLLEEKQRATVNRNWLVVSLILLLLGTGLTILLQKNAAKKRKLIEQQEEIQKQKVETLLKEQELTSIDAMIAGQEKERQRVANELHDDLGSLMATVKLHFNNIETTKEDSALQKADQLLDLAYQKVRGIAHAKNSGVIANQGLVPAVQRMAKTITETNKIKLEVHHFGLEERMENSLELSIFRMIQELVTNTIKHAEATKGSIQLTQHEQSLNILIEDNGKGFDTSKIPTTDTGMGLHTIEKRIEHLEGNFTVDSILGKGTSIIIDIPI